MNRIALKQLRTVLAAHKATKARPVGVVASPLGGWLVDVPARLRSGK